jgi:hypothetical protein
MTSIIATPMGRNISMNFKKDSLSIKMIDKRKDITMETSKPAVNVIKKEEKSIIFGSNMEDNIELSGTTIWLASFKRISVK